MDSYSNFYVLIPLIERSYFNVFIVQVNCHARELGYTSVKALETDDGLLHMKMKNK